MKKTNIVALSFFALFVLAVIGCDGPKNVVKPADQTGLTSAERKDKRGE